MEKANNIVIFGANGDLAVRKLLPALYHLFSNNLLIEDFKIYGVVRSQQTADGFQQLCENALTTHVKAEYLSDAQVDSFIGHVQCVVLDVSQKDDFQKLAGILKAEDRACYSSLFYLATPPDLFLKITSNLKQFDLLEGDSRLVIEKPIGKNLATSMEINHEIGQLVPENTIFRIDHYMGKSTVQNLLALRFANRLLEPLWNQHHIDSVQVTVSEEVGVEGRWNFYDEVGALRDMVQNHLLQLLCLIAMEPPIHFDPMSLREEKIKVLRSLRPIRHGDVKRYTVRGQYRAGQMGDKMVDGYTTEANGSHSNTETFVALKVAVDNWRWEGVPFYLRTGKRMAKRFSEIVVQFKPVTHEIFSSPLAANQLIIRLQPDEFVQLILMNKEPGLTSEVNLSPVPLNLNLSKGFGAERIPEAYERLLFDAIKGDSTLFMSKEEVEASWRWIDAILDGWQEYKVPCQFYNAGTMGPEMATRLLAEDGGRQWHAHSSL